MWRVPHEQTNCKAFGECWVWRQLRALAIVTVATAFAVCLTTLAHACQITVIGTQGGINNSVAVDCISITNATVAGDVNNTGSILQNGIVVSNSTVSGVISNIGPLTGGNSFTGGILADSNSSITGGVAGFQLIGISTFSGGITSNATITAGTGIYVDSVSTFTGGINNGGLITGGNGISVSNITSFSGGVSNSGRLTTTNYGISILGVSNFVGGVSNTGDISSTGVNRAGISLFNTTVAGGITNSGTITAVGAGISLGDISCFCVSGVNFSGGILNSGSITGGVAGIYANAPFSNGVITNTGLISGQTGLLLTDGISVFNSGTITGTGGTAIELGAGTLTLAPTSVINGNVVAFGGNGIFQLGGNGVGTFDVSAIGGAAQYRGFTAFNKVDSSTWNLTGTSTHTVATTIDAGTLNVNGSIATSSGVTVNSGGTLGGVGIVSSTVVASGGTLAPGNSIGTITVNGNLSFNAGSGYRVEVSSAAADRTNVTGTATLTGGAVQVVGLGLSPAQTFTILNATGGLAGTTFAGLTVTGAVRNPRLTYDVNNVFLTIDASTLSAPPNAGGNGANVAGGINNAILGGATPPAGFNALLNLSGDALTNALAQVSGEGGAGSTQAAAYTATNQFFSTMLDPSIDNRGDLGGPSGYADEDNDTLAYAGRRKLSKAERDAYTAVTPRDRKYDFFAPRLSIWAAGYGGSSSIDGNATAGTHGTTSRIYGTAVGADFRIGLDTVVGLAMGGGRTSFNTAEGLGGGSADLFQVGVYGRRNFGAAYLAGAVAYGWQDVTTERTITVSGSDRLRAEFNTHTFAARAETGYRVAMARAGITPYAGLQVTTFFLPAYTEAAVSGSSQFALAFASQSATNVRTELGLRTDKSFAIPGGTLMLLGRAAWAHDSNTDRTVTPTFQTLPGSSFTVNGATPSANGALLTGGAEMRWRNGWLLAGIFESEFSHTTTSFAGKGTVKYAW